MRAALLTLAVIGSQLTTPASQRIPVINIDKVCKSRLADDKIMREPSDQSLADCVREEDEARQELIKIWAQIDSSIRDRCASEAAALGTRSYLDFLSCLQILDDIKSAEKARVKSK